MWPNIWLDVLSTTARSARVASVEALGQLDESQCIAGMNGEYRGHGVVL